MSVDDLRWLLDLDLSDPKNCSGVRMVLTADEYSDGGPWRNIPDPIFRRQIILIWLQNELRRLALVPSGEELKRLREQSEADRRLLNKLKTALEDEILQGASIADYERCWRASKMGDDPATRLYKANIDRKRAAWRAKREEVQMMATRAWQADSLGRQKRAAKVLRERVTGVGASVNWFAPMAVYAGLNTNEEFHWDYCHATGQSRIKVKEFLRKKKQKPIGSGGHAGGGRPFSIYGFKTNLTVLGQWLGDWLLNSPHPLAAVAAAPERVCEEVAHALSCAIRFEFENVDPDASELRAVLFKHWSRWWGKVTDEEVRTRLNGVEDELTSQGKIWQSFLKQARARREELELKSRAGYYIQNGEWIQRKQPLPMPYVEVELALDRFRVIGQ